MSQNVNEAILITMEVYLSKEKGLGETDTVTRSNASFFSFLLLLLFIKIILRTKREFISTPTTGSLALLTPVGESQLCEIVLQLSTCPGTILDYI